MSRLGESLRHWFAHPRTRGLDIDDPETTRRRRVIVKQKTFLRKLYADWYRGISSAIPVGPGRVVEIGSGPGFLAEFVPGLVTSEIFPLEGVSLASTAEALPLKDGTAKAIVMVNVLHHVTEPDRFFEEASRCLRIGGVIVLLEPWVTRWSTVVYRRLHHEPFDPNQAGWRLGSGRGALSRANGALPWILLDRDHEEFAVRFPSLAVASIEMVMPFSYLLSGGIALRALAPGWAFGAVRTIEGALRPWAGHLAMFARCILKKVGPGGVSEVQERRTAERESET